MLEDNNVLKAVLVGCGGMGKRQAGILMERPEFELCAVCDLSDENRNATAALHGVKGYDDFNAMLETEKPDVVIVTTSNVPHAPLTIAAAEFGVRGVYCEKPMAMNLAEARRMVQVCKETDTVLVINHQRRIGPDLLEARRQIKEGAIGKVLRVRGHCGGDILSDGTHVVDCLMWLLGDPQPEWILGQFHRQIDDGMLERAALQKSKGQPGQPGYRFGHPVENGGMAIVQFPDDGPRMEVFCGDMRETHRTYQDYEIIGSHGRIWRSGDKVGENLFIQTTDGGPLCISHGENWAACALPDKEGKAGGWSVLPLPDSSPTPGIPGGYERFARTILEGEPHPMAGHVALKGFEIVMGIYESARLRKQLMFPLEGIERFPLEVYIEETEDK
jgi:UDP-N-acetyl-2-amino-2-deoxyglucuronate dehydrogenase